MIYLFTLDSHDLYGPFENETAACAWGKKHSRIYQLLTEIEAKKQGLMHNLAKPF